jgi:hypothetical protein
MRVEPVSDEEFLRYARLSAHPVPIEQSPLWDAFDATLESRTPWQRLALWGDDASRPEAVIALTQYAGRGFEYLWARHGPIWIGDQTASAERAARKALADYVSSRAPHIVFVRLHARHPATELLPLLQTITYDRTVQIDLTIPESERMAGLSKSTRKKLRRALTDDAVVITEETSQAAQDFSEYYAILEETAERDGFGVYGPDVYQQMVNALAPAAHVFVARRTDDGPTPGLTPGRAVSWILCTTYDGGGMNYYSGQTAEGRSTNVGVALRWHVFNALAESGVRTYDLMGVDSPRAPSLTGVGEFKRQFGPEVAVDGAWDLPLQPWRYRALRIALRLKRLARR